MVNVVVQMVVRVRPPIALGARRWPGGFAVERQSESGAGDVWGGLSAVALAVRGVGGCLVRRLKRLGGRRWGGAY